MTNSISNSTGAMSGNTYCRSADWMDVVKFFVANYLTHAFTVITHPGDLNRDSVVFMIWSLFTPFAGVARAVMVIAQYARGAKDDLSMAHRAGALYTLVKVERQFDGTWNEEPFGISQSLQSNVYSHLAKRFYRWRVRVHGVHPLFPTEEDDVIYFPTQVLQRHTVRPLAFPVPGIEVPQSSRRIQATASENTHSPTHPAVTSTVSGESIVVRSRHSRDTNGATAFDNVPLAEEEKAVTIIRETPSTHIKQPPLNLSSNYSAVKAGVAIFQVLYGSWELYVARDTQLQTYGYAAYSLTVVPYVAMSLLNLLATLCRPQYPHVYLVHYADSPVEEEEEENIQSREVKKELNSLMLGAVGTIQTKSSRSNSGRVWGDLLERVSVFDVSGNRLVWKTVWKFTPAGLLGVCAYLAPYVVTYVLTGYKPGAQSTLFERGWIVAWLLYGQALGFLAIYARPPIFSYRPRHLVVTGFVWGLFLTGPGWGVFVIVARMILESGTCKTL
ncbi:hypothetical protein K440DRAFT_660728 [Wilcoxina mikolae CBS 423.85]|nr:hypothetical protein K440DRAFT_660728 [Wilcoxina mikolae CBS 423.85]